MAEALSDREYSRVEISDIVCLQKEVVQKSLTYVDAQRRDCRFNGGIGD